MRQRPLVPLACSPLAALRIPGDHRHHLRIAGDHDHVRFVRVRDTLSYAKSRQVVTSYAKASPWTDAGAEGQRRAAAAPPGHVAGPDLARAGARVRRRPGPLPGLADLGA